MKPIHAPLGLLLLVLLAACGQGISSQSITSSPGTETTLPSTLTPSAASGQSCYYNWATQFLSDLSARIQKDIDDSGLKGVTASANAYGENCYDINTNQVVSFASMETDIQVTAQVKSIKDTDDLGGLLERILAILEGLPTQSLSAGHLGYIGITYQAGAASMRLWFMDQDARAARERGLHGADLIAALQKK
jgi:hypothetical protein